MSDINKKNINYGALNRFYQDLKSHDLSDLNDKIDNIKVEGYQYDSSLNAISAPFDGDETLRYVLSISYNSEGFSNKCDITNLYFWDDSFVWNEVGEEYGRDYDFSGLKIYHNGSPVATINTNCYSEGELAFNILESGNPFVEGEEYYIQSVHLKHPLTNKDEIALCKTTISHEGKTLLSVGRGNSSGRNIIEVTNDGNVYIEGIGNYYGNENSLSNKKSLRDIINEKADSSALALKANKVDYIVPLTLDTETYEYVPDYSVLNSATTDGSYTLKYVFTQNNVDTTVAYGNLQVSQGGMLQTIHYFNGTLTYTMRMHQNNQWMTLQEFTIPCIWQSNIGKSISSYSAEKVDELIASLEARITALEGNSTVE